MSQLALSDCQLPGLSEPARCGTLAVPENPDQPAGRHLSISVAVLPAVGGHAKPDPIAVLMGGPGEDAISAAATYAAQFASVRQDRDILLVDQRGTGRSGALHCDLYSADNPGESLRDVFPLAAIQRCARILGARADLTQYTYDRFARDLEQVRRALGYEALNLFGASYGTRAAQVYLRMYPMSVRTAFLSGIVPMDVANPLPMARNGQAALEETLQACVRDAACHAAFPNLPEEFQQFAARLAAAPVSVKLRGYRGALALTRGRVAEWFRTRTYRPYSAVALPRMIHQAHLGDFSPIARAILESAQAADSELSFGLFFAITCSEDVPFIREDDIERQTAHTFLGDYRVRQQQAACRYWPRAALPPAYSGPIQSSVSTVFASGDEDGATPRAFAQRVGQGFSNRFEVVLRGQGHTEWNECAAEVHRQLIVSGSVEAGGTRMCPLTPRPPFELQPDCGYIAHGVACVLPTGAGQ